jgi:hypothetical protein
LSALVIRLRSVNPLHNHTCHVEQKSLP